MLNPLQKYIFFSNKQNPIKLFLYQPVFHVLSGSLADKVELYIVQRTAYFSE